MSLRVAGASPRSHVDAPPTEEVDSDERLNWLLAVCCIAQFLVILDLSIVNVALPSIQSSLRFSSIDLQWVVDAYAITFAGFLMLGGRATDQFGARRTLVAALSGFALASLVGGLAGDRQVLIGARAFQGLSGAFMAAGSLAAITSFFPQGPARHRAIGLWGAMNGAGGAAGTFFGGLITQELGWRWILLINPPIGFAAAIGAYAVVSDRRNARKAAARFDLAGALTLTVGLVVLVYGIVTAGYLGWRTTDALGPIVAGFALLGLFVLIEARFASSPLVPLKALTGPLRVANGIVLLFSAALFPMWYLSSLYLQQVLGLSPLDTGLVFLPMALTIMVVARRAGKLVSRFGTRSVLTGGLVMMACGLLTVRPDRAERQRGRFRRASGRARRAGDRVVRGFVDDRCDAGVEAGAGGNRSGSREHLAPDGWRDRARAPHLDRVTAHDQSDRPKPRGARSAHTGLPPRLLDRRRLLRPRRGRGRDAAAAGRRILSRPVLVSASRWRWPSSSPVSP